MPRQITQYRIFIGSPGGLRDEREAFRRVLTTFNEHHGEPNGIVFAPIGWEDTLGGVGRPQELINEDLRQCDFAIFVFHDRWGSPTGNAGRVGTEEEWQLVQELYEKKTIRKICLFFKDVDPGKLADPGVQLQPVLNFKAGIERDKKHLFLTYGDVQSYCTSLEKHLASWMREIAGTGGKELAVLSHPVADDKPTPASEMGPSFSFWLHQSRQLSSPNTPTTDIAGARFCAEMALKLAHTDAEWADAQSAKAVALDDPAQSFDLFSEIADRLLASSDPVLKSRGVGALVNKAFALDQLGRGEEELAIYDDIVSRFGTGTESAVREHIARTLFNKGVTLGELGRSDEAIAVYDDVLGRFGTTGETKFREHVARSLVNKTVMLGKVHRGDEAIATCDEVVRRFGTASEIALREQVARALVNKGVTLGELGRDEEGLAIYDDLIGRFGSASETALRERIARALVNKGIRLGELGRGDEAIAAYEDAVGRFGSASETALREQVARALVNKGITLSKLGRGDEAIATYEDVVGRFGVANETGLRQWVDRTKTLRALLESELEQSKSKRKPTKRN
jgi:tetratricopeptide (TPR) repeat protein